MAAIRSSTSITLDGIIRRTNLSVGLSLELLRKVGEGNQISAAVTRTRYVIAESRKSIERCNELLGGATRPHAP